MTDLEWVHGVDGVSTWVARDGGGGGSAALTASVTTADVTFAGYHDFDLSGPASGLLAVTVTAISEDGETFGASGTGHPGFILEDAGGNGPGWSDDNVTFHPGTGTAAATGFMTSGSSLAYAVGQAYASAFATPRYLRVPIGIFDADGFTPYSGVHHPTVTVRVDVVYLTP